MENTLKWKSGFFNNCAEIFSGEEKVGQVKPEIWTQSCDIELNGKFYYFKTDGFFRQSTQVIDKESDEVVGQIAYNAWGNAATMTLDDQKFDWKYENLWQTKWSLTGTDGTKVSYKGNEIKGEIVANTQSALVIMSGFYVTSYFQQMLLLIFGFVPIWMLLF